MAFSLAAKYASAVLLLLVLPCHGAAHNITAILGAHPGLAEFTSLLASTGLAHDINRRNAPITVLAVDNAGMAPLKARRMPRAAIRRRLSLHVLTDYDGVKLRSLPPGGSAVASTLFPASSSGAGGNGMVKIVMPGLGLGDEGRARFLPVGSGPGFWQAAFFVKSVYEEAPRDMSVFQVSAVMSAGGPRKATH
ncbi:fasciclin-like arabinogalactan protein 1 [Hordeum vulgare]|uniref:FAS1 domain-containing protein n=1 Tax=Hordeum vulgare subsp. vulgare TaxID=112509 RepID=A0A8I6YRW6_HORVV|nr:fasciclin-like arabinogalactan protein 1 [Hordeum vulgare subsp. vulgare]KAE8813441.1 fasciclin-like arabinogalactan protein 1 [Hordeum vulgare]KAI4979881.1 hypothetical protein ZWY2020_016634 [Hordeum vulgare]